MVASVFGRNGSRPRLSIVEATDPELSARQACPSPTTVLVVDDHAIVRAGVADILRFHGWISIVGEAEDGREALDKAKKLLPDLVIVDLNLPRLNGLGLIKCLRSELPQTKCIILSMHSPEQFAVPIIESGAHGYVRKTVASTELITALETVACGATFFDSAFSRTLLNHLSHNEQSYGISPREREVLVGIAEGLTSKEIASRLEIGVRTVDTHRERLTRKLNIHNAAGLTRFALQQGLVPQ